MTHERLEDRLRSEPMPDESHFVARPLPATAVDARAALGTGRPGAGRTSWFGPIVAVAGAAAVVAAVVVASAVLLPGRELGGPAPTGSGGASPLPSAAEPSMTTCSPPDFAVASDPWDAGAGSRGTTVVLRVVQSVSACQMAGAIEGRLTDATGAILLTGSSEPMEPATLAGGEQFEIGIAWSNWCGPEPAGPVMLSLVLPGDSTPIPVPPPQGTDILVPPCNGAGQASNLSLTTLQPSSRPPIEG